MNVWSFADKQTGEFTAKRFRGPDEALADNTPPGMIAVPGQIDPMASRLNVQTGEIETWQSPAPSDDHEWDARARRWVIKPSVLDAMRVQAEIEALERSQPRMIRELLLGDQSARARLADLDSQIVALRERITKGKSPLVSADGVTPIHSS